MKTAYWVLVAILGLLYVYAGVRKLTQTQEQLRPLMAWVDTTPMWLVRLSGVLEIAGVVGLVLPPLTGILPALAVVAAVCLAVLQVLAAGVHLSRGEAKDTWLNVVLIVLAAVAAWLATAW